MKKGFSLVEVILVLGLISLSIVVLVSLAVSYLSILNSVRQRYIALNLAQEGLELIFALRNQNIAISGNENNNWLDNRIQRPGIYCIEFNTSTRSINVLRWTSFCKIIDGYSRRLIVSSSLPLINSSSYAQIISEVKFGGNDSVKLDTIITRWHPTQ